MTARGDCPHLRRTVLWLWIGVFCFVAGKAILSPLKRSCYPGYAESSREWITEGSFQAMNSFQHLPYFSDLVAPFAACPDRIGAFAWAVLLFSIYATGLRAFLDHFPVTPTANPIPRELILLSGLLIGCGSLANHQSNMLVIGCWLWGSVAVLNQRWWLAAFLFALPGYKIYTWAAGLVFAAIYPRQLAARFAVMAVGCFCLPFLFHPVEAVTYRFHTMSTYLLSGEHYKTFHYLTFYETWRYYLGPVSAQLLLPIQALAGIAVPLVLWILRRRGVSEIVLIRHGLFLVCLWCVSFGPSIEPPTYLLVAPVLGWAIAQSFYGVNPSASRGVLLILVALLAGSPLFVLVGRPVREWLVTLQLSCLSLMLVYLVYLTAGSWALQRTPRIVPKVIELPEIPQSRAA